MHGLGTVANLDISLCIITTDKVELESIVAKDRRLINFFDIIQFPDLPGKQTTGKIEFMNPEINPQTRINLLRVTIANPGNLLKPGMPAYVTIKGKKVNSLTLPSDAVLRTGTGASVWVQTGKGAFKSIMVEIGMEDGDRFQIKSGLQSGDIVVIRGAYLLNSEFIFKQGANPMEGMKM